MKVLFIGGTGNISTEVSKLCVKNGIDLYLLNRGNRKIKINGCKEIVADISNIDKCKQILKDYTWDVVVPSFEDLQMIVIEITRLVSPSQHEPHHVLHQLK